MAENFNANYVYDMFERYFDTKKEVVEDYFNRMKIVDGKVVKIDKERLQAILKGLESSLSKFCDKTSNERKHKVAMKLLNKLNYDSFFSGESYAKTQSRLDEVYTYTSGKNINAYNIIGSTMLVEANLGVERNGYSKKEITGAYEWAPRMVWNIYDAVCNIGFTDEEAVQIFEKAKTIFSKGLSSSIDDFDSCVENEYFVYRFNGKKYYNVFDKEMFKETIKNCQTILVYPAEKIKTNFGYIINRTLRAEKDLQKNYNFAFEGEKISNEEIAVKFAKFAATKKASLLTCKIEEIGESSIFRSEDIDKFAVTKKASLLTCEIEELGEISTFRSEDIDKFVDENIRDFISNDCKIVLNAKEEDYTLNETELLAKNGNNIYKGSNLEKKNLSETEELYIFGNPGKDDMTKDNMEAMEELVEELLRKRTDEVEENVKH